MFLCQNISIKRIKNMKWSNMSKLPKIQIDSQKMLNKIDYAFGLIERISQIKVDFSNGAYELSSPDIIESINEVDIVLNSTEITRPSTLLRFHQISKRIIRKVPDNALLGMLVLTAAELLQREMNSKAPTLPSLLRDLANTTISELDIKLETLTKLQWNFDPFIQAEFENLQTQPLEALDKYLVNEILPKVDKDLSPILNKLITDPKQVTIVTNNIKDLIQVFTYLIVKPNKLSTYNKSSFEKTIMESVDIVGQSIEDGKSLYFMFSYETQCSYRHQRMESCYRRYIKAS